MTRTTPAPRHPWRLAAAGLALVLVAGCASAPPPPTATPVATQAPDATGTPAAATPEVSEPPATPAPDAYTVLTPAPATDAGDLTWALYREAFSLDPFVAFDYPENTVVSVLCDTLLRQSPDMTIQPGLATMTQPDPTTLQFKIAAGATFWDGSPVTADDVAFSLKRAADPNGGGYYAFVFDRVTSITAISDDTVELKLSKADTWLPGELAAPAGAIVQRKYAESKAADFGTVNGGLMCSGPFKLDTWRTGQGVKVVPTGTYWDSRIPTPRVKSITFIGVPDDATFTAGVQTGAISGGYYSPLSTLGQLVTNPNVTVSQGAPYAAAAMVVSATTGPMADPRVRKAISLALDRAGIINAVFKNAASIPHALQASATWGYARDVFAAAYDALPAMDPDLEAAKALIKEAGAEGKTITIGTSAGLPAFNTEVLAFKAAAESIGLTVNLKSVSPDAYVNFFLDPAEWTSVDAFPTTTYGDYADPAALYKYMAIEGGSVNFSGWTNPDVAAALEAARGELDEAARAQDVADAQAVITDQLPWIPIASVNTVLVMHKSITGAPATFSYMFGPWAAYLGGSGN